MSPDMNSYEKSMVEPVSTGLNDFSWPVGWWNLAEHHSLSIVLGELPWSCYSSFLMTPLVDNVKSTHQYCPTNLFSNVILRGTAHGFSFFFGGTRCTAKKRCYQLHKSGTPQKESTSRVAGLLDIYPSTIYRSNILPFPRQHAGDPRSSLVQPYALWLKLEVDLLSMTAFKNSSFWLTMFQMFPFFEWNFGFGIWSLKFTTHSII